MMTQARPWSCVCPARECGSRREGFGRPLTGSKGAGEKGGVNKFLSRNAVT